MNAAQKILKNWDTPEYQEKLKKLAQEYKMKLEIRDKKIEKMFSNTDYINWLIKFTIKNDNSFSDNDWLYTPDSITKNDSEKVNDLCLFYEGINEYAENNNIGPKFIEFGNEYNIKINDIGIEIGIMNGQGTLFYCKKIDVNSDMNFIDFNDVINNKNNNKTLKRKK